MNKIRDIEEKIVELEGIKVSISRAEGKLESALQALHDLGYESTEDAIKKLEQLETTIQRREVKLEKEVEDFLEEFNALINRD